MKRSLIKKIAGFVGGYRRISLLEPYIPHPKKTIFGEKEKKVLDHPVNNKHGLGRCAKDWFCETKKRIFRRHWDACALTIQRSTIFFFLWFSQIPGAQTKTSPESWFWGEKQSCYRMKNTMDPGHGRGVCFCIGSGSLARVTPLFLCGVRFSWCYTFAKSIRNGMVIFERCPPKKSPNNKAFLSVRCWVFRASEWLNFGTENGRVPPTVVLVQCMTPFWGTRRKYHAKKKMPPKFPTILGLSRKMVLDKNKNFLRDTKSHGP